MVSILGICHHIQKVIRNKEEIWVKKLNGSKSWQKPVHRKLQNLEFDKYFLFHN